MLLLMKNRLKIEQPHTMEINQNYLNYSLKVIFKFRIPYYLNHQTCHTAMKLMLHQFLAPPLTDTPV